MKQNMIVTGKTVEAAVKEAAEQLGVSEDSIVYEVIEQEKAGFLGIGATPAKISVAYSACGDIIAKEFVETIIRDLGLDATVEMTSPKKSDRLLSVTGDPSGVLIGHHGDTLDALQYLTNLAANKREEDESRDYVHITVDVENYRAKREATLRALARRMASKALKSNRNIVLEPMNPYERRIIHSEIQNIEGVSTNSVGEENNRRVVIYLESLGFSVPENIERGGRERRRDSRQGGRRGDRRSSYAGSQNKPKRPAQPKYNDGEQYSAEEVSELISTYATKEKPQREPQRKFKDFDEYMNSILGLDKSDK